MDGHVSPQRLTEMLRLATESAAHRDAFFSALLASDVFIVGSSNQLAPGQFEAEGQTFTLQHDDAPIDVIELTGRNGSAIPFWTSLDSLERDLHVLKLGQRPYMTLDGLRFLQMVRGRRVVLNPGTFGRDFSPEQVASILHRAELETIEELPTEQVYVEDNVLEEELPIAVPPQESLIEVAVEETSDLAVVASPDPNAKLSNMFLNVTEAIELVRPLFHGRSDESWTLLEKHAAEGRSEGVLRALTLLLFTAMDTAGKSHEGGPEALLDDGAAFWAEWAVWAAEQEELSNADVDTLRDLTAQRCGCGHAAFRHGKYSWTFRDVGMQASSPCDERLCLCEAFFTE